MRKENKKIAVGSKDELEQVVLFRKKSSSTCRAGSTVHISSSPVRDATDESFLSNNLEPKLTREGSKFQLPPAP